jgi:hypothetical protein
VYIVAITRLGRPLDDGLAELSELLGMQPYDLRLRLAGVPPFVVAAFADAEEARRLMATLRERSHGSVACDVDFIPSSDTMISPRSFELGDHDIAVADPERGPVRIPYAAILALLHAQLEFEGRRTTTTTSRKLSVGRAVMTGGLLISKKVSKEQCDVDNEYEQVLYVIRKNGRDPVVLRQNRLTYSGLGERIGHSSVESFANLVAELRERAPEALYDARLLTRRRRSILEGVQKRQSLANRNRSTREISSSNSFETDLAAHIIAVAHLRGQL